MSQNMTKLREKIYVECAREFDANITSVINLDKNNSIDSITGWLNALKVHGATHIQWRAVTYDGESDHVEACGFYIKTESDSEYEERMRTIQEQLKIQEEKRAESKERQERSEYRRLKKKYGAKD